MTTSPELQTKILEDFLHYSLPEGLLDYIEPVMAEDKEHQVKKDEAYKRDLHMIDGNTLEHAYKYTFIYRICKIFG